jgi:HSP20 family protein
MTLVRWQPQALFGFHNDFNRFFEGFRNAWGNGDSRPVAWRPSMDVSETEQAVVVQVDLPGLSREEIKVNVDKNVLTVHGEKRHESEEDEKRFHWTERTYGSFKRSFTLPSAVDAEKISAAYTDGVLTLTLPKTEEARPKEIEIKAV